MFSLLLSTVFLTGLDPMRSVSILALGTSKKCVVAVVLGSTCSFYQLPVARLRVFDGKRLCEPSVCNEHDCCVRAVLQCQTWVWVRYCNISCQCAAVLESKCLTCVQFQSNTGARYATYGIWYCRPRTKVSRTACEYGLAAESRRMYASKHASCGGGQSEWWNHPLQVFHVYSCGRVYLLFPAWCAFRYLESRVPRMSGAPRFPVPGTLHVQLCVLDGAK